MMHRGLSSSWSCFVVFALLSFAAMAGAQAAEVDCETALREAERSYLEGRLDEVWSVRDACLEGRASRDERLRAWVVLAKAYLDEDRHDEALAAVQTILGIDPGFRASLNDPYLFVRLVDSERAQLAGTRVVGVSKVGESLREAPATAILITAQDIERRGYQDLEEVLHDLPGFDISRGNGDIYSNLYLRGYRSDRSDRMLFLVDGVEQNDLHSNTSYLSRQYPLSNVEQVEVIYGPASTIYGANAFTGVISVTTKSPAGFLEEGKNLGVSALLGTGSFGTGYLDATLAGRTEGGRLRWSLTGRTFRSDEPDLSRFDPWDYDIRDIEELDYYRAMRIEGPLAVALAEYCDLLAFFHPVCQTERVDGQVVAIGPTALGVEEARRYDLQLFEAVPGIIESSFDDSTDDWAIDAKVELGDLTFGVQTWRREEGTAPWYTDSLRAGQGNVWTPQQTNVYARYSRPIGGSVVLSLFSRFKQHELDSSSISRQVTYSSRGLNVLELGIFFGPAFQSLTFDQKSTQFRNELTLVYQPSQRFSLISGLETRNSSIQLEFTSSLPLQVQPPDFAFDFLYFPTQLANSQVDSFDLGLFAQASYKLRNDLKVVLGGRVDTNSVRNDEAFLTFNQNPTRGEIREEDLVSRPLRLDASNTVFNPRLALVYTRGPFVWKAIYAEAFKEPSSLQRYTREPGVRDFPNPKLVPEKVKNLELSLSYQPRQGLSVDVAAYEARYNDSVALTRQIGPDPFFVYPSNSGQFKNIGKLRIRGIQANVQARLGLAEIFGNYTFTEPFNTEPVNALGERLSGIDEVRIGDIASHQLNLGANLTWGERWNLNLRGNWVGPRKTGKGTTVLDNPLDEIDAYFVVNVAASYSRYPAGGTWQLVVRNLFDEEYFHPGVQRAGAGFASRLPQPGRALYLRFLYKR